MDWKQKFKIAQEHALLHDRFKLCFDWNSRGAPGEFISSLSKQYQYCPKALKEMLLMSDGVYINSDLICGSPRARFRSIASLQNTWSTLLVNLLPFGSTADNGVYFCSENGEITLRYIDDQSGKIIAPNMDFFFGEVLMGKHYGNMFKKGFGEDDWTQFLRSQYWL